MKKILLAAVAALAIVGCSQNEEIEKAGEKAEINFSSIVGKSTRATEVTLDKLKTNGFYVYAYNTGELALGAGTLDKSLMENEKVSWDTGNSVWKSATYYWPSTGNVQFFAYASTKASAALTVTPTDNYPTIANYTVSAKASEQEDLLVAKVTGTKSTKTVTFVFSHILTQVNFSIKAGDATDKLNYIVTELSLQNIGSVATYSYDETWGSATNPLTYACALDETEANNTVTGSDSAPLGTEALMLLPQTLGSDAKIVVKYKIVDAKGVEYYSTPEGGKEISLSGIVWNANNRIRYTLTLTNGATPIGWDVEKINGWDTEGNTDKNTPAG